jgi:hypothetical protein
MVREKDVRDAEIWPCSAMGEEEEEDDEAGAVSAKRSRSLRREEDWRRAELKRAFCGEGDVWLVYWLVGLGWLVGWEIDG